MTRFIWKVAVACLAVIGTVTAGPQEDAKALFDRYVRLEHAFDPDVADLYADDAVIRNKRTYPNGQVREITFPTAQYKSLVRQAMPLARAKNDTSTYSQITISPEGGGMRIRATRFSNSKKYSSPFSMLISPDKSGTWLIREELSESRP